MNRKNCKPPDNTTRERDLSGFIATGDDERMTSKDASSLDELAKVRKPGKGALNLGEAAQTVIEQAIAYEAWQELGAPAGILEVWVEGSNVMTLQPGETTDFKSVLFEMPSLKNAVVQVVRQADEVADTVVLFNHKLASVPAEGVEFVEEHPNKQTVILKMKPAGHGKLTMWLGFSQTGSPIKNVFQEEIKPRGLAASARAALRRLTVPSPAWGIASVTFAAMVLFIGVQVVSSARRANLSLKTITRKVPEVESETKSSILVDSSESYLAQEGQLGRPHRRDWGALA
jgi:hypothetical protein